MLISSAEGLEFVKLELPDGDECKIDLREYPTENTFDPFPDTEFCDMREILLFEETFLGHVRVANAGMARPVIRLLTEGSIYGFSIGGVFGCIHGKLAPPLVKNDTDGQRDNRIITNVISAIISYTFVGPGLSRTIPLMERIAPRETVYSNFTSNKRLLFKSVPSGAVAFKGASMAYDFCREDAESLQTAGIIDYRLDTQDLK